MEFSYIATNPLGDKQKGVIEAGTEKEVVNYLRSNQLIPIKITNRDKSITPSFSPLKKIKSSDLVLFTRQLSSMILTGLTLLEALQILKNQTQKPEMRAVITDLVETVSGGEKFSKALDAHPKIFSKVYVALIAAAESSGLLDKVLARLADNLEKSEDLKKKVKSAFFYPAIVVVGVIGVIVIMNVVVIPQLGSLYQSLNVKLPLTTQIVLGLSHFTTTYFYIFVPILIALWFLFVRFSRTDSGIRTIDKYKTKIPIIGQIFYLSVLAEVCQTLSLLINSGCSIIQAINITADTADNIWYHDGLNNTALLVEKGVTISDALAGQKLFPPIMIQMVKVGESTGKIDDSLERVSEYFDRDLNLKVKTLTTAIEPILIVTLGGTVGFLILSVITPIYTLISNIH